MSINALVGAVTDTSAWVRGKVTAATTLRVADNPGMSGAFTYSAPIDTTTGVASAVANGLDPDTAYWWELDSNLAGTSSGRFHTHGPVGEPYSFSFGYATCAGLGTGYPGPSSTLAPERCSDHPVFDDIAAKADELLFFIDNGDTPYYDLGSGKHGISTWDTATYRRQYDDWLSCPRAGNCFRQLPIVYMWDDHDFGVGDSDRTTPGRAAAGEAYRQKVPHYPLGETSGGAQHAFQVGRVQFLISDVRYYRDPPTQARPRTMLGSAQKTWMENVLASSDAELLVWVAGQRWIAGINPPNPNWGSYEEERLQVRDMFADHGWLEKMVVLHGDNHAMGLDSGRANRFGGFPMFCFSPFDSNPAVGSIGGYSSGGRARRGQYGTVDVTDLGSAIVVNGTGWYVDG